MVWLVVCLFLAALAAVVWVTRRRSRVDLEGRRRTAEDRLTAREHRAVRRLERKRDEGGPNDGST